MRYNLDGKTFRVMGTSTNGQREEETLFHYRQWGDLVTAEYAGGAIDAGQILAQIQPDGRLDLRYRHITAEGELLTGTCLATPEEMPDGRLRLHKDWQWLGGEKTCGCLLVEEVAAPQTAPDPGVAA